jgi:hypothetical protein
MTTKKIMCACKKFKMVILKLKNRYQRAVFRLSDKKSNVSKHLTTCSPSFFLEMITR